MRNIWIIFKKELHAYFVSPIAYLLLTMFGVIFGFMFWNIVASFSNYALEAQMQGQNFPMNINEMVIRPLFGDAAVVGLFFIPLITMRLFAEEKRTGTIELLATSPIHDMEIILGKWFAAVAMYVAMLLFAGVSLGFLFKYGNPDWRPLAIGFLGLLLQGSALLALGTFISTLTRNQIIAAAVTFGVCLLLWLLSWANFNTATWAQVLSYCSVTTRLDSFAKGVIDLKDATYFVSLIFLGLFLTSRSMESLRWRS